MIGLLIFIVLLMFPYAVEGEGDRRPLGTLVLCVGFLILHALLMSLAARGGEGSIIYNFFQYGVFPADFRWYSPLTSLALHGDYLHVLGNVFVLWIYGSAMERRIGSPLFLLIFLVAGYIANLGYVHMVPPYLTHIPSIGASAAIAGVMGFVMLVMPGARVVFFTLIPPHRFTLPAVLPLTAWFIGQLFSGFASIETETIEINHWAHIYGFIAGVLAGLAYRYFVSGRSEVATIKETSSVEEIIRQEVAGNLDAAGDALAKASQGKDEIGPQVQIERIRLQFLKGQRDAATKEAVNFAEDMIAIKDNASFLQVFALLASQSPETIARPDFLRTAGAACEERGNARDSLRWRLQLLSQATDAEHQERTLFQIANLALQKLRDVELARQCLKAHIHAFPAGRLTREAEFILTRQLPQAAASAAPRGA